VSLCARSQRKFFVRNGNRRIGLLVGPATDGNSLGPKWRFDGSNQRVPSFRIAGAGTGRAPDGTVAQTHSSADGGRPDRVLERTGRAASSWLGRRGVYQ
jgi:hypothetical protein